MKTLFVLALAVALAASAAAQSPASFTGKWEGVATFKLPDGEESPNPSRFDLTQQGTELTGTAGPTGRELPIEKGVVTDGKATFQIQIPGGPRFKFALTLVDGHLKGEVAGELDGVAGPQGTVDAAPVK